MTAWPDTGFTRYASTGIAERPELLTDGDAPDLLVLDAPLLARRICEHAAEVLRAIVYQRCKPRPPIVVTAHRVVQDRCTYLGDVAMVATTPNRLVHRCAMLEFEGTSHEMLPAY